MESSTPHISPLKQELSRILRNSVISDSRAEFRAYGDIGLPDMKSTALAVVSPSDYDDISSLLDFCREHETPLVPWGGGTNLCGALSPGKGHIILDMRRLSGILEVSPEKGFIRVQGGASIENVMDAARAGGCIFGHDPWSKKSATVGGSISLDSAGNLFSRYGSMGDNVLSLRVMTGTGDIIETGRELSKWSTAPRLQQLFVGSHGVFGIILEACLRIHPMPPVWKSLAFGFRDFDTFFDAFCALRVNHLEPDAAIGGTLPKRVADLLPGKEKLLIKLFKVPTGMFLCYGGSEAVTDAKVGQAKTVLAGFGRLLPQEYADEWWENRYTYFESEPSVTEAHLYPHVLDMTMPLDKVREMKDYAGKAAARHGLEDALSHTLFTTPDAYTAAFYLKEGEEIGDIINDLAARVIELGGTIARTHGLGSIFPPGIARAEVGAGPLKVIQDLKGIFDPHNLLNPGIFDIMITDAKTDPDPTDNERAALPRISAARGISAVTGHKDTGCDR